jgi:hypothetical protein
MGGAMGEVDLIERALAIAPWAAPVLAGVVLLRKEIAAFLSAGRNETAMEGLTGRMVSLFEKNLEYFAAVEKGLGAVIAAEQATVEQLKDLTNVQRQILQEIIRDGQRRGG